MSNPINNKVPLPAKLSVDPKTGFATQDSSGGPIYGNANRPKSIGQIYAENQQKAQQANAAMQASRTTLTRPPGLGPGPKVFKRLADVWGKQR
jgi:hypothetical protein